MKRVIAVLAVVVLVITIGCVILSQRQEEISWEQYDMERLSQEDYSGVFLSMYPISEYNEDDFAFYRGVKTVKVDYQAPSLSAIAEYLETVFASKNEITHIYLGIDPALLWESSSKNIDKWNKALQEELLPYLEKYPQVSFEVLLPYYELDYWTNLSPDEREVVLNTYINFIQWMEGFGNVSSFFPGAEQWLIGNPGNYTQEGALKPLIAQKLLLLTFCDREYQIVGENMHQTIDRLREFVAEETENPTEYPDLSDWKLIFWGDSVIGNYVGSFSVPGVVTGLSEADTYNYAISGTQAADMEEYQVAFPDMIEQMGAETMGTTRDETQFPYEVLDEENAKLCFLVHYGLNDYFNGVAVENPSDLYDESTFAGALRVGVKNLKDKYPNAVIILMTPPFCRAFSDGTEKNSEMGGVLTEYVAAVEQVAEEQGVICMNNYLGLGITPENDTVYLADGVHLNEYGRFVLGQQIVEVFKEKVQ